MSIVESILTTSIKSLAAIVTRRLEKLAADHTQDSRRVAIALERHLVEVGHWTERFQFYGMSTPRDIESSTIELNINEEARQFSALGRRPKLLSEEKLVKKGSHCLLLGEPGSGKTTTLKRIARRLFAEAQKPRWGSQRYPIVIRLRELLEGESLLIRLAETMGLEISSREVSVRIKTKSGEYITEKHHQVYAGDLKIQDAVPIFLNKGSALVLLDGLDEVRAELQSHLRQELMLLSHRLTGARLIVSCRTGDYASQMEGFTVFELCPLSEEQVIAIGEKWLGPRGESFQHLVRRLPYQDLVDRPLLLTQLLFIYRRYGSLPEQTSVVYRKVIRLLLEEWDAERGIHRKSKYANFDPERKAEFLSAMSYHLTYVLDGKVFSESDLVCAYLAVRHSFDLPEGEARVVAREIQTHTGIIIAGPRDRYEFCHLSLQEYLCANFLVRAPYWTDFAEHLGSYVAPLAVAVTLSSKPSDWLANIVLTSASLHKIGCDNMTSFLSRLFAEGPVFETSEALGFAVFNLYYFFQYDHTHKIWKCLERLTKTKGVVESLSLCLRNYRVVVSSTGRVLALQLRPLLHKKYLFEPPQYGAVPRKLLPVLVQASDVAIGCIDEGAFDVRLTLERARELASG